MEKVLEIIKDEIYELLLEMYPEHSDIIKYHYNFAFSEWFNLLYNLHLYTIDKQEFIPLDKILVFEDRKKQLDLEYENYKKGKSLFLKPSDIHLETITLIEKDGLYYIVDGYHRVYLARLNQKNSIKACIWKNKQNIHSNCRAIKNLIIEHL